MGEKANVVNVINAGYKWRLYGYSVFFQLFCENFQSTKLGEQKTRIGS